MTENIFVLGLDEHNHRMLQELPDAAQYRFHPLLSIEELQYGEEIPLCDLLDKAVSQLESFDGTVDAVIGFWDFPVSSMVPILCQRYGGLCCASLEAVLKCEHKYWSRLEQQKVIDAHPAFGLVDLDGSGEPPEHVRFPMWLKPVKSFSSELAFKVSDRDEFDQAVEAIRAGIGRVGKPFDYLLSMLDLPEEIAAIGGQACLAEEAVGGQQITVEGFVQHGEVHAYGVIDSVNYEGTSSFLRYQYPSQLPAEISHRLIEYSERVIRQVGLDNSTFNVEYFWDPETDEINLLEVNPRLSQSHARMFEAVNGLPNHQCMVRLALGRDPELPYRRGEHSIAGKCFLRRFSDGLVRRVPTGEELEQIAHEIPGVAIDIVVKPGDRLSDLPGQDSYSYELADIFVGADDQAELIDRYERCVKALHFEFDD